MQTKQCKKCGEVKSLSEFHKDKNAKDGHEGRCKECMKAKTKAWYEANKEYAKAKSKEWYEANPEHAKATRKAWREANPEHYKAIKKAWYEDNKEHAKAKNKAWREANPEREKAKAKAWREANPNVVALKQANRRALKNALPHTVKKDEWRTILANFNNKCMVTGKSKPALEHFIPLSWGHGGTTIENIYPLHGSLNGQKSSKNPFDFLEELTGYHRKKYEEVIRYIADQNNMTWQELHKYVNWCEKNKRTVEQVIADNERGVTSMDLYKQSLSN